MRLAIEALLAGRGEEVAAHFLAAKTVWKGLLVNRDATRIGDLASSLPAFEREVFGHLGGHSLDREIMVASGIGYLVWRGQPDLAEALVRAFLASACHSEVKAAAERIARLYDLDEELWGKR